MKGKSGQPQLPAKKAKDTGFITPCKPSLKNIVLVDAELDDATDSKRYLSHTAQSINRAISRFNKDAQEPQKEPERAPDGKVKLVEPKEFTLRSDLRCEERRRIKDQREKSRREKELLEMYLKTVLSNLLGKKSKHFRSLRRKRSESTEKAWSSRLEGSGPAPSQSQRRRLLGWTKPRYHRNSHLLASD